MKRKHFSALICLFLLSGIFMVSSASADTAFSSIDAVEAFMASCSENGTADFTFSCNAETFSALSADDFSLLYVLEAKCGIAEADLRYSESSRTFLFDHVVYDHLPWAECRDENALHQAVSRFAESRASGFRLLLSPQLCQTMYAGGGLHMYAAWCGIADLSATYSLSSGIICARNILYSDVPVNFCADAQSFFSTVEMMANSGATAFRVCLDPAFFQRLDSDADMLRQLLLSSCLDHYSYLRNSLQKSLIFSEVTYSFEPRMICHTEDDIIGAIRSMGVSGKTNFMLILDHPLYDAVSRNSFQRLHALESEAGLSWCTLSYSSESSLLLYADAVIHADAVHLSSVEALCTHLTAQAADCPSEMTLFLTDSLYAALMQGLSTENQAADALETAAAEAGIFQYSLRSSDSMHTITLHQIVWYPGARILHAARSGDDASLTAREKETMVQAASLAGACRAHTPLETARNIHDRLAERITYTLEDAPGECDTALGALLNGRADCDGYADAFFLTASLAGLRVRCQHGSSYRQDAQDTRSTITHMWNLLEIDGSWRLVDVTWDDTDSDNPCYTFFNIGYDRASRTHVWNESVSPLLAPRTDLTARPAWEYTVSDLSEAALAIDQAAALHQTWFHIIYTNEAGAQTHDDIIPLIREKTHSAFTYSWNDRLLMLTVQDISF